MRKFFSVLSVTLFAVLICGTAAFAAAELMIVPNNVYLSIAPNDNFGYGKRDLSVILSEDGKLSLVNSGINWNTSSADIVKVAAGTISADKVGGATITATVGGNSATCNVTVSSSIVPLTRVDLNKKNISLFVGETDLIREIITSPDAAIFYGSYKWTSSNENVATVKNGFLEAIRSGTTIITVTENYGSNERTDSCIVTVYDLPTRIDLGQSYVGMQEGQRSSVTIDVFPLTAPQEKKFNANNPGIAYLINTSVGYYDIIAARVGTTRITITTPDGKFPQPLDITVTSASPHISATNVSVIPTSASMKIGENITIRATVTPGGASNKVVEWSSSNESVAKVEMAEISSGRVTAVGPGNATITAKTVDGGFTATCTVTVVPTAFISIDTHPQSVSVVAGNITESLTVAAQVTPSGTLTYQWYSNTANNNTGGTLIAGANGAGFFIPTNLTTGVYYYYCVVGASGAAFVPSNVATVTVGAFVPVTNITGVPTAAAVGTPLTLTGTVNPNDATNKTIVWSLVSADGTGAVINGTTFSATAAGTAVIRATITNGTAIGTNYTQNFNITVSAPPTAVISIDTHPQPVTVTAGSISGSLSVAARVTPSGTLTYQWYSNITNSNVGGTALTGATSASFDIPTTLTVAGSPYHYFCEVRATGAAPVRSNAATVTVIPATVPVISIDAHPQSVTVTAGSISGSLLVTARVTPSGSLTYQWYSNITNSNEGGTVITGATSASFNIPTTLTVVGSPYYYFCEVRATGAAPVRCNAATVTVNAAFVRVADITGVQTAATAGTPLTLTGTVSPDNATYKTIVWSLENAGGTGAIVNGGVFVALTAGTATVRATIANGTAVGTDYTKIFSITVTGGTVPVISIDTHPQSATFEEGSITGNLTVAASVAPSGTLTYQWYSNTTNSNTGGTLISGATSANFAIPTTLTKGIYHYYCLVSATGAASVPSNAATVTVNKTETPIVSDPIFLSKDKVVKDTKLNPNDLEEKNGKTYLKKGVAESIAKKVLDADCVIVNVLPIFKVIVTPGGLAEISFKLTGKELLAPSTDEIKLIGLLYSGGGKLFDFASKNFDDGNFTIRYNGAQFEGGIDPKATYELVVFIRDGDIFDLDGVVNGEVIGSVFLAKKINDGGGGGCSAGYGYLAFTLLAIPFVLRKKK